ncbi:hypothetical protein [Clostridium tyrobutyricum]|uniref:hypothetical protein n=1 Tax=Clostridium tyrobutyricum TaxID=1519 RepID=UPI001C38E57C|nr:hypothetical protein [Clostridium tyrobutyricum]MBV4417179.1 hypothetical protein [Clostridium tyrobutyricum]
MSKYEEDIKMILNSITDNFSKEIVDENKEEFFRMKTLYESDTSEFFSRLWSARLHLNTMLKQIINIPSQKNMHILEYVINGLYEHFFDTLIEKTEGVSCSSDKSKFITEITLKALKENKNLSLYDDYTNCECIKENKQDQAYWSPKTIKDTDTAMKMFWDWYLLRV